MQQLFLLVLSVAAMPFYFYSLDIPKQIVNEAIGGEDFPQDILEFEFDQIAFLMFLSGVFLLLVLVNGGFKYVNNVYRGIVGERMLRRLRFELISRVLRFPLPQFRKTSQGEVVSIVSLETEPLGGFFADAFALVIYQGGLLATLMAFMFVQDWKLGLAAIILYPPQAYLIPILQRKVNALGKQRVQAVRELSERIGEAVGGASEIHANDTSQFELADFSRRLGVIYRVRFRIYVLKFLIKFINNTLALLTPFFFYSIGGWLVIQGDLTLGALVAVLSAYKDVSAPWKMLLTYYQRMEDARIKFTQIADKFQPAGMLEEETQTEEPESSPEFSGKLVASNISLSEDDGLRVIDGASLSIDLPRHVALVGPGGSGKNELSQVLARLLTPDSGRLSIGDHNLIELPETVVGRKISYVGQNAYMFAGTIRDNLLYGLKHRPQAERPMEGEDAKQREWEIREAKSSGNLEYDRLADWVDMAAVGGSDNLAARINEVLRVAGLSTDIYQIGLRRTVDPQEKPELAAAVLEARKKMRRRLEDPEVSQFVEGFDSEKFNTNASVAENILFGTPVGDEFAIDRLGENAYVLGVLETVGLSDDFLEKGLRLAEIMVDIFQGLPPDHEFFERFSFIGSDDLPEFQTILARVAQNGLESIGDEDMARLRALPFRLIPARHHLGLIDPPFRPRILEARKAFHAGLPEEMKASVEFFDVEAYNAASPVQDNILFGKLAGERAGSAEKVGNLVSEVVDEAGLRQHIVDLGLDYNVGVSGARLSSGQRQKLGIARGIIRKPDILVINEALSGLDPDNQSLLLEGIRRAQDGRSLIYVDGQSPSGSDFEQVVSMASGKVVDQGLGAQPAPVEEAGEREEGAGGFGDEIDVLSSIPLFEGMDRSRLKLLTFASDRHIYDPGQVVIRQGEVGETAYIIISGTADIILETADGPTHIATLGRNDQFGELALLCEAPRTATVTANEPLTVLSISKDVFIKLIAEDAEMSARITRSIAERLERTTRDLSAASTVRDPVTNLADARIFRDRLRHSTARFRGFGERAAILIWTLDNIHGADGGLPAAARDSLFKEIAERLTACTRETDTRARLSETEFGIILSTMDAGTELQAVAQRIADYVARPVDVDGHTVKLGDAGEIRFLVLDDGDADTQLEACRSGEGQVLVPSDVTAETGAAAAEQTRDDSDRPGS